MTSVAPEGHRAPPEEIRRITSWGADQFVLACTARQDASDVTFREIELLEADNSAMRKEVAWVASHSVTRTARYIRSRLFIMGCVTVTALAILGWLIGAANGRQLRVLLVAIAQESNNPKIRHIDGRAFLIRDMPQREVDSVVRVINNLYSPFLGR